MRFVWKVLGYLAPGTVTVRSVLVSSVHTSYAPPPLLLIFFSSELHHSGGERGVSSLRAFGKDPTLANILASIKYILNYKPICNVTLIV